MPSASSFTLSFLGAAETVTGSRYLLESAKTRVLVDCGLFQGYKKLRLRNWSDPGFTAASLDAVILTHAHLDHSGYLPRLFRAGFRGRVHCTPGTRDLLAILLPDAGHLQEEEAKYAARTGYSRHDTPLPLFTRADAEDALTLLEPVDYGERFQIGTEVTGSFTRAGHIVGSASLLVQLPRVSIAFSGDVGRAHDALMRAPDALPRSDFLVIESTYGDRLHSTVSALDELRKIVRETALRGGSLVVPAFAVGRAQLVLYFLAELLKAGQIPELPIYLDSPLAIDATAIFRAHAREHKLDQAHCQELFRVARYTRTADESKAIDAQSGPLVVISGSGMATGGRVLHHLKRFLPDPNSSVLLVGYQASGTRGRSLLDGAEELKMHGQYVPVRARVHRLDGLSAHADYSEILNWLRESDARPRRVFVTHGEPQAADALRRRLNDAMGLDAVVPDHGSRYALSPALE